MGYTVAAPIKNEKLRDQVVAFLDVQWRTWPQLHGAARDAPMYLSFPHPDGCGRYEPKTARNLDYDSGKCRIGFNFNATPFERDYGFDACKWMALRWGKLRKFKVLPYACPHIVYDGHDAWPVIVEGQVVSDKLVQKWDRVDRWGVRFPDAFDQTMAETIPGYREWRDDAFHKMREEFKRLDAEWAKQFGEAPAVWQPPGVMEASA